MFVPTHQGYIQRSGGVFECRHKYKLKCDGAGEEGVLDGALGPNGEALDAPVHSIPVALSDKEKKRVERREATQARLPLSPNNECHLAHA